LFKGDSKLLNIKSSAVNNNAYLWTVPAKLPDGSPLPNGTDYRIKVTCLADTSVFGFSDYFEICPPGDKYTPIKVTVPDSNSIWDMGGTYPIDWTGGTGPEPGMGTEVRIKLFKGSEAVKTITASTDNNGHVDWTVPYSLSPGANYRVKVISSDYSYVSDYSSYFAIRIPPIDVTVPAGGEEWKRGSTHDIQWTGGKPSKDVKIQLLKGGSLEKTLTTSTANDGLFSWTVDLKLSPRNDYRIRVIYLPDTTMRDVSETFAIIP
jgi:5-hydroxyisourate hydrolase-like protein (transthyretin family)